MDMLGSTLLPTLLPTLSPYDPSLLWIVIVSFVVSFFLAFGVGANDVANSFGTSVGSKVLTIRQACILATIFEISGAVLLGYQVSDTMRKGIVDPSVYNNSETELMMGNLAALGGSGVWLLVATFLKLPISGTHSIVGATIGFSLVTRGTDAIKWFTLVKIVASWFISPVLSGLISSGLYMAIRRLILRQPSPLVHGLRALPIFYALTLTINVFSIVLDGPQLLYFDRIPWWGTVIASCGVGIVAAIVVQAYVVPRLRRSIIEAAGGHHHHHHHHHHSESRVKFTFGGAAEAGESSNSVTPDESRHASMEQLPYANQRCSSVMMSLDDGEIAPESLHLRNKRLKLPSRKMRFGFRKRTHSGATYSAPDDDDDDDDGALRKSFMETHMGGAGATPAACITLEQPTPTHGLSPNSSAVPLISLPESSLNGSGRRPAADSDVENQAAGAIINLQQQCPECAASAAAGGGAAGALPPPGPQSTDGSDSGVGGATSTCDEPPQVAKLFSFLQILTASFGSFAHGGNDVSNAIGPLVAVWLIYVEGSVGQRAATPPYILLYGGLGITVGLWVWGRRVIKTIGEDIAKLTASSGFTIEIGAAFTVLVASKLGLPISTTHCKVGSVVFVGWVQTSKGGVDWKLFRNIIFAWAVTVPIAGGLSAALMAIFQAAELWH